MTNIFSISLVTVQYFFPPRTYNFVFSTYCYILYLRSFTANVTLLLRLKDALDGIWTSCGLRRQFRSCYGGFSFYNHSDIMTKMVWSQGGHIKRRLPYCVRKIAIVKNIFYCTATVRTPCIFVGCLVNHFLQRVELK